ncbi:hypothetical protein [Enterovirga sp.]|uniref:hypothetical protein n=1 Tax=Enterovirga sp. TaxID=2026350 RepID=UPI002605721E|nr:hypothetical protein [Enterovirga sp.]MDB5589535.1 hypothetical protein [Enterovirga sp.]
MSVASAQFDRFVAAGDRAEPSRPSLFARAGTALREARMRQAEREIGRFIEGRGGRITDALERQIERHFV